MDVIPVIIGFALGIVIALGLFAQRHSRQQD
jgi:hypothetical protein